MIMKSLKARQNALSEAYFQLEVLDHSKPLKPFAQALKDSGLFPLRPYGMEIFQINIGKMCNQTCRHCHVDAGPDRKEMMSKELMEICLKILQNCEAITTVDITGGAPEMHPEFRWFVEQIAKLNKKILVRCNLTILVANKKYNDLPNFYKTHSVEVISSLPFYAKSRTDNQRGDGVFEDSVLALKMLNQVGYGHPDSRLTLNLVYNPSGAFLPANQSLLEKEFKNSLFKEHGILFNQLFTITNMPISRYLEYLLATGNYESYMTKLISAFNPLAARQIMCRNMLSVSWDGFFYDCDFNQMLDLKVDSSSQHVMDFKDTELIDRTIVFRQHCYGCTAGAGSSCGGAVL